MSSSDRFLWWTLPAIAVMLHGLLGCGSRYEPAPQGGGEAPAVASAPSPRASSAAESGSSGAAESASKQGSPSGSAASAERAGEDGGGLFRALLEPILSASGAGKPAGDAATQQPGGAGAGSAAAGQSSPPSPGAPAPTAGTPAAPSNPPAGGDAAGSLASAGPEQLGAAPPGPGGPATERTLFSNWRLGERLDLIAGLNRSWQVIGPRWRIEPTGIVSPDPAGFVGSPTRAVLLMPCTVPSEFRWTVVAERLSGQESLNLFFALPNNRRTMVVLEGFGSQASGLNLLDGLTADRNATTYRGPVFVAGKPTAIELLVRRNLIQVSCDGKSIIDFRGDEARLSLDQRIWGPLPWNRMGLAIYMVTACSGLPSWSWSR